MTPPEVSENEQSKILRDFQILTSKMVANQLDFVVVDKLKKRQSWLSWPGLKI